MGGRGGTYNFFGAQVQAMPGAGVRGAVVKKAAEDAVHELHLSVCTMVIGSGLLLLGYCWHL